MLNKEDVIRMAKESGLHNGAHWSTIEMRMKHFADLVAAAVREECASLVENADTPDCGGWSANWIAEDIRSIGIK